MKKIILFSVVAFAASAVEAQDIHFSQFYMSPLTLNPALAGAQHDLQFILNYKDQWQSVTNPYKTVAASFDMRLNKNKSTNGFLAAGMNFYNDNAGSGKLATTQAALSVAYHVNVNSYNTFGGGLQAGFGQRSVNIGGFEWQNQYDGMSYESSLPSGEPGSAASTFTYADLGAGLDWNYDNTSGGKRVTNNNDQKFNIGIGLSNINEPKYSFYGTGEKLLMRSTVHGTATLSIPNSNIAFVPGVMYARQGTAQEFYGGSLVRYTFGMDSKYTGFKQGVALSVGAFMRARDAVSVVTMFEFSHYAVGFSYDLNTSKLRTSSNTRGGFELSIRFVSPSPFVKAKSESLFN